MNGELRRIWEEKVGHDPAAHEKLDVIDGKITNIRRALEDGLSDAAWANERLHDLQAERAALVATADVRGEPPQIDVETALAYRRQTEKILSQGSNLDRKRIVRSCVEGIKLAPDNLEVEITYRLPGP